MVRLKNANEKYIEQIKNENYNIYIWHDIYSEEECIKQLNNKNTLEFIYNTKNKELIEYKIFFNELPDEIINIYSIEDFDASYNKIVLSESSTNPISGGVGEIKLNPPKLNPPKLNLTMIPYKLDDYMNTAHVLDFKHFETQDTVEEKQDTVEEKQDTVEEKQVTVKESDYKDSNYYIMLKVIKQETADNNKLVIPWLFKQKEYTLLKYKESLKMTNEIKKIIEEIKKIRDTFELLIDRKNDNTNLLFRKPTDVDMDYVYKIFLKENLRIVDNNIKTIIPIKEEETLKTINQKFNKRNELYAEINITGEEEKIYIIKILLKYYNENALIRILKNMQKLDDANVLDQNKDIIIACFQELDNIKKLSEDNEQCINSFLKYLHEKKSNIFNSLNNIDLVQKRENEIKIENAQNDVQTTITKTAENLEEAVKQIHASINAVYAVKFAAEKAAKSITEATQNTKIYVETELSMLNAIKSITDAVSSTTHGIEKQIGNINKQQIMVNDSLKQTAEAITNAVSSTTSGIEERKNDITNKQQNVNESLKQTAEAITNAVNNTTNNTTSQISNKNIENTKNNVDAFSTNVAKNITEAAKKLSKLSTVQIKNIESAQSKVITQSKSVAEQIKQATNATKTQVIKEAEDKINELTKEVANTIVKAAKQLKIQALEQTTKIQNKQKEVNTSLAQVPTAIQQATNKLKTQVLAQTTEIQEKQTEVNNSLVQEVPTAIQEATKKLNKQVIQEANNIVNVSVKNTAQNITEAVNAINKEVFPELSELKKQKKNLVKNMEQIKNMNTSDEIIINLTNTSETQVFLEAILTLFSTNDQNIPPLDPTKQPNIIREIMNNDKWRGEFTKLIETTGKIKDNNKQVILSVLQNLQTKQQQSGLKIDNYNPIINKILAEMSPADKAAAQAAMSPEEKAA